MTISIQGTDFTLTDDIRELVESKLADAFRPLGRTNLDPVHVAVEIERRTTHLDAKANVHQYRAEATVTAYNSTFRAEGSDDNLLQAVVEMKHKLTRQVREWRGRLRTEQLKGARRADPGGG